MTKSCIKLLSGAAKAGRINCARPLLILLPLMLGGCETIYGWADGLGSHMPTVGEPCRNWQCITDSGQQKSDETKALEDAANRPYQKINPQQTIQPATKAPAVNNN